MARQETIKKRMKIYDYTDEKWSTGFYENIESYKKKEKGDQNAVVDY